MGYACPADAGDQVPPHGQRQGFPLEISMTDNRPAFSAPPSLTSLCDALRTSPRHAPQILAIEAVRRLGPAAGERVVWLSRRYPGVTPAQLATMAVDRHVGMTRNIGAIAGLGGPGGALAGLGAACWFTARMVLELAAGYGFAPTERRRAAELLILLGIQDDLRLAQIAVDTAEGVLEATESCAPPRLGDTEPQPHSTGVGRLTRVGVTQAGFVRLATSWMPGSSVVIGALAGNQGARRLAERAAVFYGHPAALTR